MWTTMTGWERRSDPDPEWRYRCRVSWCDFVLVLPEPVFDRDVPYCHDDRGHGRLVLVDD